MRPEQYRLLDRGAAPWLTLWFVTDYDGARAYAVGTMAGGTYHFGDERGLYKTSSKGMAAWAHAEGRDTPRVAVTWAEIGRWSAALPDSARATAAALRTEGQQIQADYPPVYPGIGRPYCWDARDDRHHEPDCAQCEQDRADLDAANAKRDEAWAAWLDRSREYDKRVRTFLDSLAPVEELTLFDELVMA